MEMYVDFARYNELVRALLTGSMDQHDRKNAIKISLGELADVWPDTVMQQQVI